MVRANGETDRLVVCFASACSVVTSGVSLIWHLNGNVCGLRQMGALDSETEASITRKGYLVHNISRMQSVRLHQTQKKNVECLHACRHLCVWATTNDQ